MNRMTDRQSLHSQYRNADTLNIRIAFHQKYSLQKEPFSDWLFSHYAFFPGMRVLEIGCGNGSLWQGKLHLLPAPAEMILTDLSPGMLAQAQASLPTLSFLSFQTADIQALPFPDEHFDLVIANMMLYHVPDLPLALSEVSRVLKPEGRFFCATVGENGVARWLAQTLGHVDGNQYPFSLQNGREKLLKHFGRVAVHLREDGLKVTDVEDLTDYVLSMASFSGLRDWPREKLTGLLRAQQADGVISIPKEYGLFEAALPLG